MNATAKEIGQKIRTARRAKDLSQAQLAQIVGINVSSYALIERGEVNVSLQNFIKILNALNLDFHDIIPR